MQPSIGISVIVFLGGLLGSMGLPLGVPPQPETPLLSKIAPQECLFYVTSSGMATPDLKNPNQTEQLLAEPAVQKAFAELEKLAKSNLNDAMKQNNAPPGISGDEIVDFVKMLLTRPMAIYVADAQIGPEGPNIRGAVAIKVGEDAEKVKAKFDQYLSILLPLKPETVQIGSDKFQSIKPAPNVTLLWGFKKNYFLAAIGEGEMEALLKRASGTVPQWLAKIRQDLPVERISTISYLNVKAISKIVLPMAGPQASVVSDALGLGNVNNIASVAGLDKSSYVNRVQISIDGEPQGLMQFASIKPFSAEDLAVIPADTTMALAAKIDFQAVFDTIIASIQKSDPQAAAAVAQGISQAEAQFGLKLREEIFGSLGDNVVFYSSSSIASPVAIVSIQLKNPGQAAKSYTKIMQMVEAVLNAPGGKDPRAPKLSKDKIGEKEVYVLQIPQPGVPPISWCLTEKELIISASSQGLQAYMSRPSDFKSIAQSPEVSKVLTGDSQPMGLFYYNVKQTFDSFYPMLPMLGAMVQQQGVKLDFSKLPPQKAISDHLTPLVTTVRRTKSGIEITERSPVPGLGLTMSAPVATALFLPAVQSSRTAARGASSMNNMKQIMLAMHNYHDANKKFPPAYNADKSGKPLLSWRVLILPMIGQGDLYGQFKLDEPWDSANNKPLIAKMPQVYRSPASKATGEKTNYLTVRGKNSVFPGSESVRIADITDGTAFTLVLVEASDEKAVVWTKPDDFEYSDDNPLTGLIGLYPNVFNAAFADGSVRSLPATTVPDILKGLFSKDGSEVVNGKF